MSGKLRIWEKKTMCALLYPLRLLPLRQNRVLLNNGLSHNYSDSPKAVAEYLTTHYPGKLELFFAVDRKADTALLQKQGIRAVRFRSLRYFLIAMTASVFLTNNGGYSYLPLRKSQLVIDTWHGGGAYKKCGIDAYPDKREGRRELDLAARKTGIFLSSSRVTTEILSKAMCMPKSVFWETGLPRNDLLIHGNDALRKTVRQRLGLTSDERLVLYAPSFRRKNGDSRNKAVGIEYNLDCGALCAALERRFGGCWRAAIRLHPGLRSRMIQSTDALNVTNYEDMQELLLATDVLVTDISSSVWDFLLMKKPCFLYAPDLGTGFEKADTYLPVREWPFSCADSNEKLCENIRLFDNAAYLRACEAHYEALGGCERGKAAELVGERIYQWSKTEKTAFGPKKRIVNGH